MIYFIRNPKNGLVKIGRSGHVATRLKGLRFKFGKGLFIAALADGDKKEEKEIHQKYSGIRKFGEWFSWCEEMLIHKNSVLVATESVGGKVVRGISLSPSLWELIEVQAKKESRSVSNFVENTISKALKNATP